MGERKLPVASSSLLLGGMASWGWYQEGLLRYMPLEDGSTQGGGQYTRTEAGSTSAQIYGSTMETVSS